MKLDHLSTLLAAVGVPWTKCRTAGFETSQLKAPEYGQHEWQCIDEDADPATVQAERDLALALVNAAPQLLAIAHAAHAYVESLNGGDNLTREPLHRLDELRAALQEAG